ncbi:MAG: ABC transporter ATP-binding protein, partial [Eubacterium sp.]|nr:ABC transporter ATP-binding protein [Eubacterium sp.]
MSLQNKNNIDYNAHKLKVFASYIRPHHKDFVKDMLLSVAIALIDLIFPYISRRVMRVYLPRAMFRAFFIVMGIMLAAYLIRAVFQYFVTVIGHRMGTLVEADMRRDVFNHMQSLSYSLFDHNRTGVLLGRVTNDLFEIVELSHHGPENILTCGLTIIGAVIILLFINPKLAAVLVLLLPVCLIYGARQRMAMQAANRKVKVKTGEINAAIESGISGIRTSKAFANEAAEDEKFTAANEAFKKSRVEFYQAMGRFNAGVEGTVGLMQVAVITVGGYLIMKGEMNY